MEGPLRKIAICAPTLASALVILLIAAGARQTPGDQKSETTAPRQQDWPVYGGSPENTRYTTLAEINRENVKQLAVAWSYDTGEEGGLQTSPLIVGGTLYGLTPTQKVFALDAATGNELWKFALGVVVSQPDGGLASWRDGYEKRHLGGVNSFVSDRYESCSQ